MDNRTPLQSETVHADFSSAAETRFKEDAFSASTSEAWSSDTHTKTSIKMKIRQALHQIYFFSGIFVVGCIATLIVAGYTIFRQATYVESINPDYSALDVESETYWTDRVLIDIETAMLSDGSDEIRIQRLRKFVLRTVEEAFTVLSSYPRAQAVTSIAMLLAQKNIDIALDNQLRRLGNTNLVASLRARVLVSQALMHLRQERKPSALVVMQQYNQLVTDSNLKLNSPINEESFSGAVSAIWLLGDRDGLRELFFRQTVSATVLGIDLEMRAYRLIAGEQVRTGMTPEALETAKRISNRIELARAWALILQYTARPPVILPDEPTMLSLLDNPQGGSEEYFVFAERAADEIFSYLAENKDVNTQVSLLQNIASSRLMCDAELYRIFRNRLVECEVLDDRVKQPVFKLLDDPESPAIRAALGKPPRPLPVGRQDTAMDDWAVSEETVQVEIVDIDPTPLRTRSDQQWIQSLLAIAQSYQSIRRFSDADRVLKQASIATQRFIDPKIRLQLLLQIAEQHIACGSIADAKLIFAAIAPELNQNQKEELVRLQIIAKLFADAQQTLSGIESQENRSYPCAFLLQEQIRRNRLDDAERTLALIPPGVVATEFRSRLNVARERANREDFNILGLAIPEGDNQEWEQYCVGLIQQGLLHLADRTADRINDVQKRADVRSRIAREYQLLYQAFNDANDANSSVRQEIRQLILSVAERAGQPVVQTAILTELLTYFAGQLQTEEERAEGKKMWLQAMDFCQKITTMSERATFFAQLIVVKNLLDNPDFKKKTMPLFTKDTNPSVIEETNRLIQQCLELINSLEVEEQRAKTCVNLAKSLLQIGRTASVQVLLNNALDMAVNTSDHEESVSILLSMIPVLKALNSADVIPDVYRLAIDAVAYEFINRSTHVGEYEWRTRDSEIERIVRSQMENGFVDDAVESAIRLNEPVLRDRLLRTAAYIYLDFGNTARAELTARRIVAQEIQNGVLQNIRIFERRSTIKPPPQNTNGQVENP